MQMGKEMKRRAEIPDKREPPTKAPRVGSYKFSPEFKYNR